MIFNCQIVGKSQMNGTTTFTCTDAGWQDTGAEQPAGWDLTSTPVLATGAVLIAGSLYLGYSSQPLRWDTHLDGTVIKK